MFNLISEQESHLINYFMSWLTPTPSTTQNNPFPKDILTTIFSYLDFPDLQNAKSVCRDWCVAASDNHIWKVFAEKIGCPIGKAEADVSKAVIKYLSRLNRTLKECPNWIASQRQTHFLSRWHLTLSNNVLSASSVPSIQNVQAAQDFLRARSILIFWEELGKAPFGQKFSLFAQLDSPSKVLAKANEFSFWFHENLPRLRGDIRCLYFSGKGLTYLPPEIGQLENLKTLRLNSNDIQELPSEIENCKNLNELDVSFNKLKSIPSTISQLKDLEILNFQGNHIQELPSEIGNCKKLRVLSASNNKLKSIPSTLGQLEGLQKLFLHENHIQELPSEIGNCKNLSTLTVYSNELNSLPSTFKNLIRLQSLDIDDNPVTEALPESVHF